MVKAKKRLEPPSFSSEEYCDICGHKGEAELLITCTKCKISCEHEYCMRIVPVVDWVCEPCLEGEKVIEKAIVPPIYQDPLDSGTRSKLIRKRTAQAGKVKFIPSEEVIKLSAGALDKSKITVAQRTPIRNKALTALYSSSRRVKPSVNQANVSQNAQIKKTCQKPSTASMSCQGRANAKHQYSECEDRDLIDVLPKINQYRPFLPALQVVWEGQFAFRDTVTTGECYGNFQAQPSCRVHQKAFEASKRLPPVLQIELVSAPLFKPNLFLDGSLGLHDIALYFSPSVHSERLKQKNASVIDLMDMHGSIMRSYIDGVELLIFAPKYLHHDSQKIITKLIGDCLLLGVFRSTKNGKVESRLQVSDTKAEIEAVDKKATKVNEYEVGLQKCKDVVSQAAQSQICDTKAKFEAIDTRVNEKQIGNNSLISRLDAAIEKQKLKSKLQELKERNKSPLVGKKINEKTETELTMKSSSKFYFNTQDKMDYPPGFEMMKKI